MPAMIPNEFIADLLARIDIVDLIDSHISLKKIGSNHKSLCPFHTEKTPSFSVNRNKQIYYCFGCGVGGNAISFVMEFNNLSFIEAIEDLATFVGMQIPESTNYQQKKYDYTNLYSTLEQISGYYIKQLKNSPQGKKALKYLTTRGLTEDTINRFSLGYAPHEWRTLESKFNLKLLIDSGMFGRNENGKTYVRFRNRLVFPIKDKRKRIVAFGGRTLDDSLPKYLNSPETAIFSKSKELYGLSELLEKQSKPKKIILVEGYMDVLMLAQFGIDYSVAILGTAISKTHIDLLFRFTTKLVFCFDGDTAGQKALKKAVQESFTCIRDGKTIEIMQLPQRYDPDSLVKKVGGQEFKKHIQNAQTLSGYFFKTNLQGLDLTTLEGKSRLITQTKPYIEKIPFGIFRDMMIEELEKLAPTSALNSLKNPTIHNSKTYKKITITPERVVLALLIQNPKMIKIIEDIKPAWEQLNFPSKTLLLSILHTITSKQPKNTGCLLESYRENKKQEKILFKLANMPVILDKNYNFDVQAEFKGALKHVIEQGQRQYNYDCIQAKLK